ncbi:putative alkaline shock family protein YloU [Friedmanniella endophytica]|uniref:Putative alkaline shock family protein YloU n=1 Tax=Microlunatus kandeliicorticis TaxID=1759536 RepID=A0A7W3IVC6_9ACTN|nr:Asp23/Gls24 family envelope stress response protein [Microlunatus kandeliicorticis]MBA8795922.1 putative alkaline shock family protein YloU [Microlunatus kandeliicorticis]
MADPTRQETTQDVRQETRPALAPVGQEAPKPETKALEAARAAAVAVPGVHDLGSTLRRRLSGSVRRVQGSRLVSATGMSAEVGRGAIALDLGLVIDYGTSAPEVSDRVRQAVSDAVHTRTGLDVVRVDVSVDDLKLPQEQQDRWDEDLRRLAAEQADRVRQIAGDSARKAKQAASDAAERAGETASQARDAAAEKTAEARDVAAEKAAEAKDAAADAADSAAAAIDAGVDRLDERRAEASEPAADLAAEIVERLQDTPQETVTVTETRTVTVAPAETEHAGGEHAEHEHHEVGHLEHDHHEGDHHEGERRDH